MEKLSDILRGYAQLRMVGAEPADVLDRCIAQGIEIWGPELEDEFTLLLKTRLSQAETVRELAEKCGCEAEICRRAGGSMELKKLRRRYVLWALPVLLLGLLLLSSLFVWQIEITGNETVSEIEILNALEDSGVYIGSFHPSFTSDNIRSLVLVKIPELKWISVSVLGSRAVIEVRERTEIPDLLEEDKGVKLIAAHSGIIETLEVLRGYPLLKKGQAALEQETLVDGAVPSSFGDIAILHASGRVFARTWQEITAVLPLEYEAKAPTGKEKTRYALETGGSRINFYSKSRILDVDYDTIISRRRLGVKGLFELPLIWVKETSLAYERVTESRTEDEARLILEQRLEKELSERLGKEGSVVGSAFTFSLVDGFAVCTLRAECLQNIAQEKEMSAEELHFHQSAGEEQETG